ncbi:MAG: methyltransferase domain-containing protein [Pseudonocardiaceae bacterium]
MTATRGSDDVARTEIDQYYRDKAALAETGTSCCGTDAGLQIAFGASQYDEASAAEVPDEALLASLGCGNPIAVAELAAGETVLDLGSGGGLDVILSAKRVGPAGRAFGVERLAEMRALAERNAAAAEVDNVEFLAGDIENIPLPDGAIDVVISNCVVNLSQDKPAVMAEVFRVLRPGGRIGIADVVAEDQLSIADRAARGSAAECIAGALTFTEYREILTGVGFTNVEVTATHEAADGMHGAIVRARRPVPERLV